MEEEETQGSREEENKKQETVSDWEFITTKEPRTPFLEDSVGGEDPFVLPVVQSVVDRVSKQEVLLDDGQSITGSSPLAEEKGEEICVQECVVPGPHSIIGDVWVREESLSREEKGKLDMKIRISGSERFILHPTFPTNQQPTDQVEFPISTIEPTTPARIETETVWPMIVESTFQQFKADDVQDEGAMLELPEDPMEANFIPNEKEGISESVECKSTEGTARSVLASLVSEYTENVTGHVGLPSPTFEPSHVHDMAVSVGFKHEEVWESASVQQESLETSLISLDLYCSEDQLDPALSTIIPHEAGSPDSKLELRQDLKLEQLEHKQPQENGSTMPESSASPAPSTTESTAQPEPELPADLSPRPLIKIEDIEIATLVPEPQDQVLPEETKWEKANETTLEQPGSFMLTSRFPVLEPLAESPSSTPDSVYILDKRPLAEDILETDVLSEEEEEPKDLTQEQTESFEAVLASPNFEQLAGEVQTSAVSPPQVRSEPVEPMGTKSEQQNAVPPTPYDPPTKSKRSESGRTKEVEKGQLIPV